MNNRITWVKIAGKDYPLNFSVKAAREVSARYGDVGAIQAELDKRNQADLLAELSWLMALLIVQGVAYIRITEEREVPGITADDLEVVLGATDQSTTDLIQTVFAAISGGSARTVVTEDNTKNAGATSEQ